MNIEVETLRYLYSSTLQGFAAIITLYSMFGVYFLQTIKHNLDQTRSQALDHLISRKFDKLISGKSVSYSTLKEYLEDYNNHNVKDSASINIYSNWIFLENKHKLLIHNLKGIIITNFSIITVSIILLLLVDLKTGRITFVIPIMFVIFSVITLLYNCLKSLSLIKLLTDNIDLVN